MELATEEEVRKDLEENVNQIEAKQALLEAWLKRQIIAFRQPDGPLLYQAMPPVYGDARM